MISCIIHAFKFACLLFSRHLRDIFSPKSEQYSDSSPEICIQLSIIKEPFLGFRNIVVLYSFHGIVDDANEGVHQYQGQYDEETDEHHLIQHGNLKAGFKVNVHLDYCNRCSKLCHDGAEHIPKGKGISSDCQVLVARVPCDQDQNNYHAACHLFRCQMKGHTHQVYVVVEVQVFQDSDNLNEDEES